MLAGDSDILLCAGTQHGDACGPLFFSVTAQDVAAAADNSGLSLMSERWSLRWPGVLFGQIYAGA